MWEVKSFRYLDFMFYLGDTFCLDFNQFEKKKCTVKKRENGFEDIDFSITDIPDKLSITYVGVEKFGKRINLVFFADPIFKVPLFGARGVVNSRNILDKIAKLFVIPGIIYARSIRLEDYINLRIPGGKIPIIDRKEYTYKKGDYSPRSFILETHEIEGKTEFDTSACMNFIETSEEEEKVFSIKEHWMANTFCQIHEDYADFGVSCGKQHILVCNNNCTTLFDTYGHEDVQIMPIRPVIFINSRLLWLYLDVPMSLTEKMGMCIGASGIGMPFLSIKFI